VTRASVGTLTRWAATLACVFAAQVAGCTPAVTAGSSALLPECVGRLEFSLPGRAEVAAYRVSRLREEVKQGSNQQWFEFADGTDGSHGRLSFFGSGYVSHPLQGSDFSTLLRDVKDWQERARKLAKQRAKGDGEAERNLFSEISVGDREGVAWRFDNSYRVFIRVGNSALLWKVSADAAATVIGRSTAVQLIGSARARALNDVPAVAGICAPYIFVADDGQTTRDVRSFYRLVDQPDVSVLLKDATAAVHEPGIRTRNNEPEPATVSFWSQLLTQAKEVLPLWVPTTRSVKLAGYTGLASFVQLTRDDNTVDYGYLAVVRGDPKAKEDTPDLMLYVVQDSKQAKAKGKEPMSKAAFIAMAEGVAASVRRRPVSGR
jgi:hypothetical protein